MKRHAGKTKAEASLLTLVWASTGPTLTPACHGRETTTIRDTITTEGVIRLAVVRNHNYGVDALLLVIAIILAVLAAFDVKFSSFTPADLEALAIAFFAGSFLV